MKKTLLLFIAIFTFHMNCFLQKTRPESVDKFTGQTITAKNIPGDWFARAQTYLATSSAFFHSSSDGYIAAVATQQTVFEIKGNKLLLKPLHKDDSFKYLETSLTRIAKGHENVLHENFKKVFMDADYLRYDYNNYRTEYISKPEGLRQNFIIDEAPNGPAPLTLTIAVSGDLAPKQSGDKSIAFTSRLTGKTLLQYDKLLVWDATGKCLPAQMMLKNENEFIISVDDKNALYPITVDPLTHAPEWEASAAGVLPLLLTDLQLQTDALFGFEVSGLGDVNGDGFDDVAVSAPGAIDVIGGNTLLNAGAVFVYFGSPAGLPTIPSRTLRSSTPIADALFGFCVSAGNVMGDGKKEVIIGAPGDSYTATVAGLPAFAQVTAGKVYIFEGSDIANNNLTAPASLFLNGAAYFSNGNLTGAGANVNINALYGFSVSTAGDMNNDGFEEVVVGAPGYADAALITARTGAVFVYTSDKISTNNPARLNAPLLLSFPAGIVNLDGLLFGFSVDGAGDYNKDGNADIVAGAPGGANLGLPGFLSGSAYVYYGNGNGIDNNIGSQLSSSGNLINTVADLFGYCVKGLEDANGTKNGNIIVSSPVKNVLSNIVGGLQLRTGSLNIFLSKYSPASTELPAQQFSSPRSTALTSILAGQVIDANVLTGFSIDNMLDANCDGYGDIIVGEPLSTAVGLIGANAVGGAAYIFTGKPDGTFNTLPYWSLENNVSFDFGVNAGSLLGYSVAGIGHIAGPTEGVRIMAGAPGGAFDYSTGVFSLGNTFQVTSDFLVGNNGLGKVYTFNFQNCSLVPVSLSSFTATAKDCVALLNWKTGSAENLSFVIIEQSNDGNQFTKVQNVAKKESGVYDVAVSTITKGTYVRIRLVQNDGTSVYSDVKKISILCGGAEELQVLPTVFESNFKVMFTSSNDKGRSLVTVTDIYGRKIIAQEMKIASGLNQITLNGLSLAPGMYYVRLTSADYKSETVKIIRN